VIPIRQNERVPPPVSRAAPAGLEDDPDCPSPWFLAVTLRVLQACLLLTGAVALCVADLPEVAGPAQSTTRGCIRSDGLLTPSAAGIHAAAIVAAAGAGPAATAVPADGEPGRGSEFLEIEIDADLFELLALARAEAVIERALAQAPRARGGAARRLDRDEIEAMDRALAELAAGFANAARQRRERI
jgi:hypothetical protein